MAAGMAAGGGLAAIGSLMAGQSQYDSLNAQADLQIKNAAEAKVQGAYNAGRSSLVAGNKIGGMVANYGASGVTSDSGSAMAMIGASAANSELDRLNILHGADLKAIQYQNEASMERAGAKSALIGSYFGAAGSVASAAGRYTAMNMASAPKTLGDE